MPPERTLLVVNFRSAALTREAIRSARAASTSPLHVVVVDNSVSGEEFESLRSAGADQLIDAGLNLGYAGAINRGAPAAVGTVLIIANPDVVFGPRSIDELAEALEREGAAMTGPALHWDTAGEWLLPPADPGSALSKLDELLASRYEFWRKRRDRRRTLRRLRFWSAATPVEVPAISGAVMCLRTEALHRLGGFDERFFLYFEEIDFMRRLRMAGGRVIYVPAARCRHLYNQSAGKTPEAGRLFGRSEHDYLRKWYGEWLVKLVRRFGSAPRAPWSLTAAPAIDRPSGRGDYVLEASPLVTFDSAAGCAPRGWPASVPREVVEAYRSEELFLRVVERGTAKVVAACRFESAEGRVRPVGL